MITKEKLRVYASYKGDIDRFIRSRRTDDELALTDLDWQCIDRLLEDATVINRKLGSPERIAHARKSLQENCEDEVVIDEIHRLAETL
jgi:hypothetical protein